MDHPATTRREPRLREPWLRTGRMIELLGEAGGGNVLLVGDAEGLLAGRLSREAGARVTWFEPCLSGEAPPRERGEFRRLCGDPCELPFGEHEFDAVGSQFAIAGVADPRAALTEWARVLKPSGVMALACRNALAGGPDAVRGPGERAALTPRRLRELLEGRGLEVRGVSTLLPDLKIPRLYRGDLSFGLKLEKLPWLRLRGTLLFAAAEKKPGG